MPGIVNTFQQSLGPDLPGWTARERPQPGVIDGQRCRLEPLDAGRHGGDLHAAFVTAADDRDWTYLPIGPFTSEAGYRAHLEAAAASLDPLHFAVLDKASGQAVGTLALMRIDCGHGVIEVGHVIFSPRLKRTALSTEAQYLLMRHVFDGLGYRRYEWKCDHYNEASRRTAARLGFQFEGVFRQAAVYKGRSRDTAWFSIIDSEWPAIRAAFEHWLAPGNFDAMGRQRQALETVREAQAQAQGKGKGQGQGVDPASDH